MKKLSLILSVLMIFSSVVFSQQSRQRILFDSDWKFIIGDMDSAFRPGFNDSGWRSLSLPHDWSIEASFDREAAAGGRGGYLPGGTGWYRKAFMISAADLAGTVWIDFDGVYMNCDVWINGTHLGTHPYGYTGFHYDLTSHLVEGRNILAVRVDNSLQPNSRWYTGSGIYRHVWLTRLNRLHVDHWGTFVTTPEITDSSARVTVVTQVENKNDNGRMVVLRSAVCDNKGLELLSAETPFNIPMIGGSEIRQDLILKDPLLWSVDTPHMYILRTELREGNEVLDRLDTPFGIRRIEYSAERGFLLNGEHVKMKGVCLHHDGGCVGAAVPERIWERRLEILKQMGCNAIRTAHNPMAPEFMDFCDRMGFLVMNEIFDEWTAGKVEYGYHNYFTEWSIRDLISFIHRDRNHPSVVMWSAGNEIGEQSLPDGEKVLKPLLETFHREDPTRPVTTGNDHIAADGRSARLPFLEMLDIVGYNYVDRWHERRELYFSLDKIAHPHWKMVGTECVSNGGIRGWYPVGDDPERVIPGYNHRMIRAEQLWKFEATHDYVIGDFMWTGIDYLGEARWPFKNASSGVMDLCGFPKNGYYFYQSQWTEDPVLHIFPHWNWKGREGQVLPVLAYTNCDTVELFLNGRSFGFKSYEFPRQGNAESWNRYASPYLRTTTADLHLSWDIPYEPGILKAVGKKDGKVVMVKEVRTTGEAVALRLTADRKVVRSDARDVIHITTGVIDSKGLVVPVADNNIVFEVEGEGILVGVDNGNPADHGSFKASERKAFHGLALAIVQTTLNAGKIKISARSEGLTADSVEIVSE